MLTFKPRQTQKCAKGLVSGGLITRLRHLRTEGKRGCVNDNMGYANESCSNTVARCASELRCALLIERQFVWLRFTEFLWSLWSEAHRFTVKTRIIRFCCCSCDPGYHSTHLSLSTPPVYFLA